MLAEWFDPRTHTFGIAGSKPSSRISTRQAIEVLQVGVIANRPHESKQPDVSLPIVVEDGQADLWIAPIQRRRRRHWAD